MIRNILQEASYTSSATQAFVEELSALSDRHTYDGYYFEVAIDREGGCVSYLDMSIEDDSTVWLGNLSTDGDDQNCTRKGYARDLLSKVVKIADKNGITLELQSSSADLNRISDDDLMKFYVSMGFTIVEDLGGTYGMRRSPKNIGGQ